MAYQSLSVTKVHEDKDILKLGLFSKGASAYHFTNYRLPAQRHLLLSKLRELQATGELHFYFNDGYTEIGRRLINLLFLSSIALRVQFVFSGETSALHMPHILDRVSTSRRIVHLGLRLISLEDSFVSEIASALMTNSSVQSFEYSLIDSDFYFPRAFVDLLSRSTNIRAFTTGMACEFSNTDNLSEAIRTNALRVKKLHLRLITHPGHSAERLLHALIYNTKIQDLALKRGDFGTQAYIIAARIFRKNTALRRVSFRGNFGIVALAEDVLDLFDAIAGNTTVTFFDFSGNMYARHDFVYDKFFELFNTNRTLKRLITDIHVLRLKRIDISRNGALLAVTAYGNPTVHAFRAVTDRNNHNRALRKTLLASLFFLP